MNERRLKDLFCKALASGHIRGNEIIPVKTADVRIIEEGHFRSFDLLIACISNEKQHTEFDFGNVLVRTQLLKSFARSEKCRIDQIRFFPVELKSDSDALDERLPNQILDAILTFGQSILVLDKKHSIKAENLARLLPATIITYTGREDYFEVSSRFDRFVSGGILSINKSILASILGNTSNKTYNRLVVLQRIIEKLFFNQLFQENSLNYEDTQFLKALVDIPIPASPVRELKRLIKETSNWKLTDYM